MDATKKQKLLEKSNGEYTSCISKKTVDSCVEQFKKKIIEVHIICVVYVIEHYNNYYKN